MEQKILPFETCSEAIAKARAPGRRIVHCHGTFDLLHPGHIKHLQEAKQLGDVLVVTLTAAPFVNKGPGRPVFSDEQRAYQLAHLEIVDFVVVVPAPGAVEIIERVRPDVYCKGAEYATPKDETDRRIEEDAAAVERCGGEVRFVGEALHSSTRLIAKYTDTFDPEVKEYLASFYAARALASIDDLVARIRKLRVLVVGELIVDRYTYSHVLGLTSKARVPSIRPEYDEDQLGGALAVACTIATYGCETTLASLAGTEPWLDAALRTVQQPVNLELVRGDGYQTILKHRYVERQGVRDDLVKLFSVNRLQDASPEAMQRALLERLSARLREVDLVVLCDYGHGLVDDRVRKLLNEDSPYLAINCQTNSYNFGFNLITRYDRCDTFSLDERELALATGDRHTRHADRLARLADSLRAQQAWLTLGSSGSLAWSRGGALHSCPAMTKVAVDTVGAGDAFYATAALCSRVGADVPLASVLANLSGALSTQWAGNQQVVESDVVVKNARYLLKSTTRAD